MTNAKLANIRKGQFQDIQDERDKWKNAYQKISGEIRLINLRAKALELTDKAQPGLRRVEDAEIIVNYLLDGEKKEVTSEV